MLNKELDNPARMQVSGKQEVALGLRKGFAGIQKSNLGPWSKSGQNISTLGQRKRSSQQKVTLGPGRDPPSPN
jgi:hypothetical protein